MNAASLNSAISNAVNQYVNQQVQNSLAMALNPTQGQSLAQYPNTLFGIPVANGNVPTVSSSSMLGLPVNTGAYPSGQRFFDLYSQGQPSGNVPTVSSSPMIGLGQPPSPFPVGLFPSTQPHPAQLVNDSLVAAGLQGTIFQLDDGTRWQSVGPIRSYEDLSVSSHGQLGTLLALFGDGNDLRMLRDSTTGGFKPQFVGTASGLNFIG